MLAAANEVSKTDAMFWLGLAVVVGCLIAAGVILFRTTNWLAAGGLVLVALIAGVLLL